MICTGDDNVSLLRHKQKKSAQIVRLSLECKQVWDVQDVRVVTSVEGFYLPVIERWTWKCENHVIISHIDLVHKLKTEFHLLRNILSTNVAAVSSFLPPINENLKTIYKHYQY